MPVFAWLHLTDRVTDTLDTRDAYASKKGLLFIRNQIKTVKNYLEMKIVSIKLDNVSWSQLQKDEKYNVEIYDI